MEIILSVASLILAVAGLLVVLFVKNYYGVKTKAVYDQNRSNKLKSVVEAVRAQIEFTIQNNVRKIGENVSVQHCINNRETIIQHVIDDLEEIIAHDAKSYIETHLTQDWDKWLAEQTNFLLSAYEDHLGSVEDARNQRELMYSHR